MPSLVPSPRLRSSLLAALAFLVVMVAPAPSRADPRAEARDKLVQGGDLLKRGQFEEALARFQEAYQLVPSPKIQYNFGLAYRGMGRKAEALEAFERFLADAPDAPKESRRNATRERAQLAGQVTSLEVKVDLPEAEVFVDGRSYGTGRSAPIYLDPGPHQLVVEKAGEGPAYTERINAIAGQKITVMARLMRSPPPEPARRPEPETRPVASTGRAVAPRVDPPPPPPPAAEAGVRWQSAVAWTTTVAAAAAVGLGVAELVSSNDKFREFNSRMECGAGLTGRGSAECAALYDDANGARRLGVAGLVVGGVLAATSVVFFAITPERAPSGAVSLSCAPALGIAGLACSGRF